jgi:hypothetical protein
MDFPTIKPLLVQSVSLKLFFLIKMLKQKPTFIIVLSAVLYCLDQENETAIPCTGAEKFLRRMGNRKL